MLNDLRYAIRTLRNSPGFALTATVSIALGIGANSTIFSLADGLVLRPLPVADSSHVLTLRSRTPSGTFGEISYPDFATFATRTNLLTDWWRIKWRPVALPRIRRHNPSCGFDSR